MRNKTYELDNFIFFLNPTEKRNSLLLSSLFRQGKVSEIISRPQNCPSSEARVKWQALDLVSRAKSYFHPLPAEKALSLFRSAADLKRQGYPGLYATIKSDAISLCLSNELFEILLSETDSSDDEELQAQAWASLDEIRDLSAIARHVKKWMRHENQTERAMALAPLLEGRLKQAPKTKRGQRLFSASRFRVLIFLKRYNEALEEANAIIQHQNLDHRESLQLVAAAINLRMALGLEIEKDLAGFWAMEAQAAEIRAVRALEFCQIEWLLFAVRGETEPGSRAFRAIQNFAPSDLAPQDDALLGASTFWGLHWALLNRRRAEFEDLLAMIGDRLKQNPKCFEWALVAVICHLIAENDIADLESYARMLFQVKSSDTSSMILKLVKLACLPGDRRIQVMRYLRQKADSQPDRERNYLDLGDYLSLLETSQIVIPRRTLKIGDSDSAAIPM